MATQITNPPLPKKDFFPWLVYTIILIVLDQATKFAARSFLDLHLPKEVIPHFFNFTLVYNRGAAWGMLAGFRIPFLILAVGMIWLIIARRHSLFGTSRLGFVSSVLLTSGIIGNAIDRLIFGQVTDFIDLWHGSYHFPCFNVADSVICIGVFLYFLTSFLSPHTPNRT